MLVVAATLVVLGLLTAAQATVSRRDRWRAAGQFGGDEKGAPEPAVVPNPVVFAVYLGWLLLAAGFGLGAVVLVT